MKYNGINPNSINYIDSGSLAVFVENTRVATFGTNTLRVTGSTILSSSLSVIGTSNITGSETVSGSFTTIGSAAINGPLSVTGSTFISSSNATQLQVGSNLLFVSGNGLVGINTVSPTNALDVNGYVRIRTNSNANVFIESGSSTNTSILFVDNARNNAQSVLINASTYDIRTSNSTVLSLGGSTSQFNSPLEVNLNADNGLRIRNNGSTALQVATLGFYHTAETSPRSQIKGNIGRGFAPFRGGSLEFWTMPYGGTSTQYMRLSDLGQLLVGSNIDLDSHNPSAIIQINSTSSGFLPPRTNLTSNISNPAQGLQTYLTGSSNEGLYYYNSGSYQAWTRILNDSGSQSISGNLIITGSNIVSGSKNIIGTLLVTGSAIVSSSLSVIGTETVNGSLLVTGSSITSGSLSVIGTETINGTLQVTGSTILSSSLSVIGTETVNGTLQVTGSNTVSGSLTVIGPVTLSGSIAVATASAGLNVSQSLTQASYSGSTIYGVNITPTLTNSSPSQTQTAFRVNALFTGSFTGSSTSNIIADFGAASVGSQLTITDVTSGSIYMVNDVSGLPIIEATSDWTVNMYNYPNVIFKKTGSALLLGVSGSVSSSVTIQASASFTGPVAFTQSVSIRNDIVIDQGYGVVYRQTQISGSTTTAVPTASLYTLPMNPSSSLSMIALITGYGTGSRDTITGEIRSTIKRVGTGSASIIGTNIRFITADFSGSDANIIVSGSNAILVVTGSVSEPYAWRATITTQIV